MDLLVLQRSLCVALVIVDILLIGSLFTRRLASKFPFFLLYLISEVIAGVLFVNIDMRTTAYAEAFRIYEIAAIVLRLGVVGELYQRICQHSVGMERSFRFGLWAIMGLVTGLMSFVMYRPDLANQMGWPQTIAIAVERWECTALFLFLMGVWAFLRRFMRLIPELRGNVKRHWILLTTYFGISMVSSVATLVIYTLGVWNSWDIEKGRMAIRNVNIAMLTADFVCMWLWFRTLHADGEQLLRPITFSPEQLQTQANEDRQTLEIVQRLGR